MTKWMVALTVAALLGGAGYYYRAELMLVGIKFRMQSGDIEPYQEISWAKADATSDPTGKPNIVLIVGYR